MLVGIQNFAAAQGVEGEPAGAAHPLLAGGAVLAGRGRRRRLQDRRARRVPRRGPHPAQGGSEIALAHQDLHQEWTFAPDAIVMT